VLAWLALHRHDNGLANPRTWIWAAFAGIGVAGNFAFYFISIENGSVAVAATLMYCAPVFVYLVSFALKLETSSAAKWGAIAVVMIGIALLTRVYDVGAAGITVTGVGAGLLAGLSYAVFIFGFKYATPYGSPQAILAIAFAVLVTVLIGPAEFDQIVAAPGEQDWLLFAALGVLGAGVSFFLYVIGMRRTAPTVASIIAMVEPVTASLFGILILGETLGGLQLVGMGLILVTATALSVHSEA
jgi:drug/metabolite transporter (DMT)-like permease